MQIFVPKETEPGEARVALVPATAESVHSEVVRTVCPGHCARCR